ncbi:MAG: PEP-CTERM sorting domain-containing protein [Cyanobacteria bacterium J06659_2]
MNRQSLCPVLIAATAVLSMAPAAQAAILWSESNQGDLSSEGLNPTQLGSLSAGSNTLSATFNAGVVSPDSDYFTFEIPEGFALTEIVLQSWRASPEFEDVAFFAIQAGDQFDFVVPADRSNADGLLGWTHLRSTQVGTNKVLFETSVSDKPPTETGVADFYAEEGSLYSQDLLDQFPDLPDRLLALEDQWVPGATGFDLPLESGTYSFWLRQGSDVDITTIFDFKTAPVSTPEPISAIAVGLAFAFSGLLLKRPSGELH